jgi:transcriptional regulator with XRE-family HTH domain
MQAESSRTIHEGRNVKRIREILGVKQEALASDLGISQQAISALEQREELDRDTLEKVARALKVNPEVIKNFNEEAAVNIVSNTFTDNATLFGYNYYPTFNPIDKLLEAYQENKKLYERLLQSEREKVEMLQEVLRGKMTG